MSSSARTEVLASTSTMSIANIGTSASITRRRELAKARSTLERVKSTRSAVAYTILISLTMLMFHIFALSLPLTSRTTTRGPLSSRSIAS